MPPSPEHLVPMWSQKALGPFPTPKGAHACPRIWGVSGPAPTVSLDQESRNPQNGLGLSRPLTQGCQQPPPKETSITKDGRPASPLNLSGDGGTKGIPGHFSDVLDAKDPGTLKSSQTGSPHLNN